MKNLTILCTAVLALVLGIFLHALVISKLWVWFIVPIFGVSVLSLAQAYGLGLFIGYFTYRSRNKNDDRPDIDEAIITMVVHAGFVLLLGWLCKTYFL